MEFGSVELWYQELRWVVESECMSVLQSKSLSAQVKAKVPGPGPTNGLNGQSNGHKGPSNYNGLNGPSKGPPTTPVPTSATARDFGSPHPSSPLTTRGSCPEFESPLMGVHSPLSHNNTSVTLPLRVPQRPLTPTPKEHVDVIVERAQAISDEFARLFRRLEKNRWKPIQSSTLRIIQQLRLLIEDCDNAVHDPGPNVWEHEESIIENCGILEDDLHRVQHSIDPYAVLLMDRLIIMGHAFSRLVDAVIGQLIQEIIRIVDGVSSPRRDVITSLDQLIKLSLDGEHMCYLISREGGVSVLFAICQREKMKNIWSLSLRTLAAICCVTESVQELERANGVDILSKIMDRPDLSESIRAESAGVVAQITSPCMDHTRYLHGFLENMDNLTRTLTGLCDEASNPEVFLLGAAALANITFMDNLSCEYLYHYHTARVLIEACQMHKADSLFAKDQVVTVLANMVTLDVCCVEITSYNGIELLVNFLNSTVIDYNNRTELSACERVHQKTAVALSRLARNPDIAQIIVECEGVERLVVLCRDPGERNNSDAVLMACVAALKKISRVCPDECFSEIDVDHLLQSSLVDSFLSSKTMEETFV